MSSPSEQSWVADPTVAWNIVLTARLATPPSRSELALALAGLAQEQGWPEPTEDAVRVGEVEALRARLAADVDVACPVSIGIDGSALVLSAHHSQVDGVGLLALLRDLAGIPVSSWARGAGERPDAPPLRSLVSRLAEVAVAPPARVYESATTPVAQDVFAVRSVAGGWRTADLVEAGAAALGRWNASHGSRTRRIAVAVGVSRTGGADLVVGENSGWLRIRNVERLTRPEVSQAVSSAPLVTTPTGVRRSRPVRDRLVSAGLRVMAPRLGSTLLVSHLGRVEATGVEDVAFFPVTGGGSGLALGAVSLSGRTLLTLRARGAQHSNEGLQTMLETLVEELGSSRGD